LKVDRRDPPERDPRERIGDLREFVGTLPLTELREQGARCMECGVPFCHSGCPLGNLIPTERPSSTATAGARAIEQLHRTNNFPEFTGRLCPAPCEAACVLEINEGNAVTIKQIEVAIVNRAWEEGWIVPQPPRRAPAGASRSSARAAGLACAQQLARAGHAVTVYERDEAGGGSVRFGVPDFKIEKWLVERRVQQLAAEGVDFRYGVDVGSTSTAPSCASARRARARVGLTRPARPPGAGRELDGVHFAMEYLYSATLGPRAGQSGDAGAVTRRREARDRDRRRRHRRRLRRHAHREGAASVTQIELSASRPRRGPTT
jgi:glutamate synthase (NADPH/NADH) small chain